jgi:hypothetical protein
MLHVHHGIKSKTMIKNFFWSILLICFLGMIIQCAKEVVPEPMKEPQLLAALPPCDSVYYVPVFSGSMMKILPKTIVPWTRSGKTFWFTKGYAFSIVNPFNYQQDSTKERVVFSDTVQVKYTDTFYICRKVIK